MKVFSREKWPKNDFLPFFRYSAYRPILTEYSAEYSVFGRTLVEKYKEKREKNSEKGEKNSEKGEKNSDKCRINFRKCRRNL